MSRPKAQKSKPLYAVLVDGFVRVYTSRPVQVKKKEKVLAGYDYSNNIWGDPVYRTKTHTVWTEKGLAFDTCRAGFRRATGIRLKKGEVHKVRLSLTPVS